MTLERAADLLDAQASAWRQGQDQTAALVTATGPGEADAVALLWLGYALWRALVPAAPRAGFVAALGEALRAGGKSAEGAPGKSSAIAPAPWLAAAALGSALSVTGLLWWRRRRAGPARG